MFKGVGPKPLFNRFAHSAWPCLVGWVGLVSCVVWCVWLVWWVCFFVFFSIFEMEKDPVRGCFFHIVWSCFMDFWSLEVTFGEILVSLGRLWTCLVPGGVQGADLVEILLSIGPLLAPFWGHCWSKTVMFLRCFFRCVC